MHNCLNVVTEAEGRPAAVLIRAVEPLGGVHEMRAARIDLVACRTGSETPAAELSRRRIETLPVSRLASGPGLLCAAFSIDRHDDGRDLCDPSSELRLEIGAEDEPLLIAAGPRMGINYAPEPWLSRPLRFFVPDHAAVSIGDGRDGRRDGPDGLDRRGLAS
jgi:DNA-3-methyladenine glycosylase